MGCGFGPRQANDPVPESCWMDHYWVEYGNYHNVICVTTIATIITINVLIMIISVRIVEIKILVQGQRPKAVGQMNVLHHKMNQV